MVMVCGLEWETELDLLIAAFEETWAYHNSKELNSFDGMRLPQLRFYKWLDIQVEPVPKFTLTAPLHDQRGGENQFQNN